jgi:hypothetical protein
MKNQILFCLIFLSMTSFRSTPSSFKNDGCKFIAEISIISVEKGAFLLCMNSGNPAACTVAFAAHNCGQNPSCEGIVKEFTEKGCSYTVKVVGEKIKIIGKSSFDKIEELNKTWKSLNSVEGIIWLQNTLRL